MSSSRVHRGRPYEEPIGSAADRASRQEDRLIALIESKGTIQRYEKLLAQMTKGSLDVPGFMKKAAVDAAIQMADLMFYGETDKVRLEASKDILDRAGHGKTQKFDFSGHMRVDHDTSRLELVNLILSSARKAGIKIKDDPALLDVSPATQTIDVTPKDSAPVGLGDKPPEGTS